MMASHLIFSRRLYSKRYKDPYSVGSFNNLAHSSGVRGPESYVWEAGRVQIYGAANTQHKSTTKKSRVTTAKTVTTAATTTSITTDTPKPKSYEDELAEVNKKVTTTKVASLFRNNLIKVFGYVLHRPNMELNSELYTSLYFILSTIKLNQVNLLSIVPVLKDISFKTSNERFLIIFEEMEKHLPVYLRCAATFWKESIKMKDVNMDSILKPNDGGPLKVDILEGMNDELLNHVESEQKMEGIKDDEKKVLYNFNMDIVKIMRYFQHHKNQIQQIFFGALLIYFPRSSIQPDLEESIQILVEFLEQNDIETWENYVSQINTAKAGDPYILVKDILHKLITDNKITIVLKEAMQIILDNLKNRNPTAINPHYNSFASLVELPKINFEYMLNYITRGAYPTEIFLAAQRLIIYYKRGYIRHITLFLHFTPYIYSTAPEVLIALLDRIIKRQPDLPAEIIDSAGAVYGYLVFTYRYAVFPVTMPDDMKNLNILFLGIRSIDIDVIFLKYLNTILTLFQKEKLDYLKILFEIPIYTCATPSVCFLQFILKLQTITVVDPQISVTIPALLNTDCICGRCKIEIRNNTLIPKAVLEYNVTQNEELETTTSSSSTPGVSKITTTTPTTTALTTLTQPTEGPISPPTTLKSTSAAPPTTVTVPDIPVNATQLPDKKHPEKAIITVVQEIAAGQDLIWVKQIIAVMEKAEFQAKIMKMPLSKKTIIITSIITLLEMVEANSTAEAEATISQFLETFLMKVKHIEEVLKLITTEKQPTRPVLARLIVAVPAPMDNETEMFQQLQLLLQKEELFMLIVNHLQKESYKNIGSLLKAVLHEEIKLKEKLSVKEIEAATYYVTKVQLLGFGQGKILWGVDVDVISQNIKIDAIMDNAIGFNALKAENRKQFNCIIRYLREHPPILQTWDKWIYYTKCGDFTKALFHLLAVQANTPSEVKLALNLLTPLINYDGNGGKATFGDEQ